MSIVSFDTHAFYVELVESGLAEKTADLIRWVVSVGLLQITFIVALMFRLAGVFHRVASQAVTLPLDSVDHHTRASVADIHNLIQIVKHQKTWILRWIPQV